MSRIGLAWRLLIFCSLVGSLHYYIWARLVRDVHLPGLWPKIMGCSLVLLAISMPATLVASRLLRLEIARAILWLPYTWMGVFFILLVYTAIADVVALVLPENLTSLLQALSTRVLGLTDPMQIDRRLWLSRFIAGSVVAAGGAASCWALFSMRRGPTLQHVTVHLARLPKDFKPIRLVQISDLHVSALVDRTYVERVVRMCNDLSPDLVVLTGDLVDGTVAQLRQDTKPLGALTARYGVYFVTGNHEYYSGADAWLEELKSLNIRCLRNERVSLGQGANSFDLAGIDDWTAKHFGNGHGANLSQALAGRDANKALVLLAHQPKAIVEAAQYGVDLQLSGHTHGGQIWPFGYLVRLDQPYVQGLYQLGNTQIYVNRGTGHWGPPMRLGAPPELTVMQLRGV